MKLLIILTLIYILRIDSIICVDGDDNYESDQQQINNTEPSVESKSRQGRVIGLLGYLLVGVQQALDMRQQVWRNRLNYLYDTLYNYDNYPTKLTVYSNPNSFVLHATPNGNGVPYDVQGTDMTNSFTFSLSHGNKVKTVNSSGPKEATISEEDIRLKANTQLSQKDEQQIDPNNIAPSKNNTERTVRMADIRRILNQNNIDGRIEDNSDNPDDAINSEDVINSDNDDKIESTSIRTTEPGISMSTTTASTTTTTTTATTTTTTATETTQQILLNPDTVNTTTSSSTNNPISTTTTVNNHKQTNQPINSIFPTASYGVPDLTASTFFYNDPVLSTAVTSVTNSQFGQATQVVIQPSGLDNHLLSNNYGYGSSQNKNIDSIYFTTSHPPNNNNIDLNNWIGAPKFKPNIPIFDTSYYWKGFNYNRRYY